VVAQLASLPSELEASFGRALPMLRDGYISEQQGAEARKILLACSLTYVVSSMVAVLYIWPWIGRPVVIRRPVGPVARESARVGLTGGGRRHPRHRPPAIAAPQECPVKEEVTGRRCPDGDEDALRRCAKSLIRWWLRCSGSY
jgi:hypothetical protein